MAKPSTFAFFCFVLFIMLAYLGGGMAPVFTDPDTAWHLATGDLIRAKGIQMQDSWSFTAADEVWYNLSWLFDIAISKVVSLGGFSALYVLTVVMFAGSMAFMAAYCIRRGASPLASALILLPTLNIITVGVLARPNMCSIPLTIAFYCLLHRHRAKGDFRLLLLLPLLMVLWVNLHGGFLLAYLLIGVFLLDALLHPPGTCGPGLMQRFCNNSAARAYGVIFACCLAAALVNPYGFGIFYGASKSLFAWFDHKYVMEWKPISIGGNKPYTLWFVVALCVGSLRDKRIPFTDRVLAVVLILMSLSSIRHCIISSLLLMPYLSLRLTSLLDASVFAEYLYNRELKAVALLQLARVRFAGGLLVLFTLGLMYVPWYHSSANTATTYLPADRFPPQEAEYVLKHYPNLRFFNHYDIGGYLIYLWRGKQKVFVDGRASSLYSDDLLRDYAEFMDTAGFSARSHVIADYYHIDGLIMPNDAPNAVNIQWNPEWRLVYRGPALAVYLRASLAEKYEDEEDEEDDDEDKDKDKDKEVKQRVKGGGLENRK